MLDVAEKEGKRGLNECEPEVVGEDTYQSGCVGPRLFGIAAQRGDECLSLTFAVCICICMYVYICIYILLGGWAAQHPMPHKVSPLNQHQQLRKIFFSKKTKSRKKPKPVP